MKLKWNIMDLMKICGWGFVLFYNFGSFRVCRNGQNSG